MNRLLLIPLVLFLACEDKREEPLPLDCAGVAGGIAKVDSCQVCDTDTTNDCLQDCSKEWGGNNICGCSNILASNYDSLTTIDDGSCLFSNDIQYRCYDGNDNDGDGLVDFDDPSCQGYFNGQNISDLNNLELEIRAILGDGTCYNSCDCNLYILNTDCCDDTIIPYCETETNNQIIDSLVTAFSILFSTLFECEGIFYCGIDSHADTPIAIYNDNRCQLDWNCTFCSQPIIYSMDYLAPPPENCEDCLDNDNDGFIDYADSECLENIIEECLSDSVSICSNLISQYCEEDSTILYQMCEDYNNGIIQECEDYQQSEILICNELCTLDYTPCDDALSACNQNCHDLADGGRHMDLEQCLEDCQYAADTCYTAVDEVFEQCYSECSINIDENYQACIISAEGLYEDCPTIVDTNYQICITSGYQECILGIEQICSNMYCTCDSTSNN